MFCEVLFVLLQNCIFRIEKLGDDVEKVPLCQETVNPKEKLGPSDFELLKVLGKGGYGKVRLVILFVDKGQSPFTY